MEAHRAELEGYDTAKGTIRFTPGPAAARGARHDARPGTRRRDGRFRSMSPAPSGGPAPTRRAARVGLARHRPRHGPAAGARAADVRARRRAGEGARLQWRTRSARCTGSRCCASSATPRTRARPPTRPGATTAPSTRRWRPWSWARAAKWWGGSCATGRRRRPPRFGAFGSWREGSPTCAAIPWPSTARSPPCSRPGRPRAGAVVDALGHAYERWDGKGSPAGLAGDAVPLPVRIASVARDVDLARGLGRDPGAWLRERRGRAYDPAVVDAVGAASATASRARTSGRPRSPASRSRLRPSRPSGLDAVHTAVADFGGPQVAVSSRAFTPGGRARRSGGP